MNPKRLGLAFAVAAGVFYLGCVFIMVFAGPPVLVIFFNGLFHGADLTPILKGSGSAWITVTGFVNTFILSWLFGALVAVVYNLAGESDRENSR